MMGGDHVEACYSAGEYAGEYVHPVVQTATNSLF